MVRSKQSKPVQKRRRIDEREEREAQEAAISLLRNAPRDVVEAAATDAFRSNVDDKWDRLDGAALDGGSGSSGTSSLPDDFNGLGRCPIDDADFAVLESLHDTIKGKAQYWTSWSGAEDDPRRRAFGFLSGTLGFDETVRSNLDVSMPNTRSESAAAEEKSRNALAAVVLEDFDLPAGFEGALVRLLDRLRPFAPTSLRRYFSMDQLVAAQPNLHSGQHILPPHVDHPQKDGFGVVIITVAIRGKAQILLETGDHKRQATFVLPPRHAYVLSGPVRNACVHGVLADEGKDGAHRESLNLRLGLHGRTSVDPPASHVLRHWRDDMP